ncbi:hypothetical protein BKA93DRAFT_787758 [Sparassis latifolia]
MYMHGLSLERSHTPRSRPLRSTPNRCHPSPGPLHSVSVGPCLAACDSRVELVASSAHAAWAPWEAQNALDAAFLAYTNISVLRQQIKPTHRVHGIVSGKNWAANRWQ